MSKSVKLSASDATTGRKKNTPMTARAGARNHQAARAVPRSTVVTAGRAAPAASGAARGCGSPRRRGGPAPRRRRRPPLVPEVGRQPAAKLADVPRAGDPHGDRPASELLIDVPDLVDPEPRREPRAVQAQVEVERAAERRLGEGAVAGAVTQDRRAGLEPEDGGRGPLVRRDEDGVAGGTALRLHSPHGGPPLAPPSPRDRGTRA